MKENISGVSDISPKHIEGSGTQVLLQKSGNKAQQILNLKLQEQERILLLLSSWKKKYGQCDISVDQQAIIINEYRFALQDVQGIEVRGKDIEGDWEIWVDGALWSCQPPENINVVTPWAWMALIDGIPGEWIEKRDNLLELLGKTKDIAHLPVRDVEYPGYCWHTPESVWDDDGMFYWHLYIDVGDEPFPGFPEGHFIHEYIGEDGHENDREIFAWNSAYIYFIPLAAYDNLLWGAEFSLSRELISSEE